MDATEKFSKNITTFGEKLQEKSKKLIQKRLFQTIASQFSANNHQKLSLLSKWQNNQPKSIWQTFAEDIQKKHHLEPTDLTNESKLLPFPDEISDFEEVNDSFIISEKPTNLNVRKVSENFQQIQLPSIPKKTHVEANSQVTNLDNTELNDSFIISKKPTNLNVRHVSENFQQIQLPSIPKKTHVKANSQVTNLDNKKETVGSATFDAFIKKYSLIKPRFNTNVSGLHNELDITKSTNIPFLQQNRLNTEGIQENNTQKIYLQKQELEEKIERSSYSPMSTQLQNFLSNILNTRIPNVKIYANQAANTLAQSFNADAVTYEDKIFFRTGKYNPQTQEGIALLGHEITHITSPQGTNNDYQAEEQAALNNEINLLNYLSSPQQPGSNSKPYIPRAINNYTQNQTQTYAQNQNYIQNNISSSSETPVPKAAPTSRDLTPNQTNSSPQLSLAQMNEIFEYVKQKIMLEIKTTFERGG